MEGELLYGRGRYRMDGWEWAHWGALNNLRAEQQEDAHREARVQYLLQHGKAMP